MSMFSSFAMAARNYPFKCPFSAELGSHKSVPELSFFLTLGAALTLLVTQSRGGMIFL